MDEDRHLHGQGECPDRQQRAPRVGDFLCFFDFTGDVFVRVVCKNKKFKTCRIRPDYRGVIRQRAERLHRAVPAVPARERQRGVRRRHHQQPPALHLEAARHQGKSRERQAKQQGRSFVYYRARASTATKTPSACPPTPPSIWPGAATSPAPSPSRTPRT